MTMYTCGHLVERNGGEVCGKPAHFDHPWFALHYCHTLRMPLCAECYDWVCKNVNMMLVPDLADRYPAKELCTRKEPHDHHEEGLKKLRKNFR